VSSERVDRLVNNGKVKGAAVKRETVRGKPRYFALVRIKGEPYRNPEYLNEVNKGAVVGLDAGPSKLVAVSNGVALEINRAPRELLIQRREEQKKIRRTQRALDRSRRATNPECFDEAGRYVKGKRITVRSKAYERKQRQLAAEQRRQRVSRRRDETTLTRQVMRLGTNVVVEDVDYRSWQASRYGKRMGFTAPGALMARVKREAALTGGGVTELPLKLALTQRCVCDAEVRKGISERVHSCSACGLVADRDAVSAWLCELIGNSGVSPLDWITSRGPLVRPADATRLSPVFGEGSLTPRDGVASSSKRALACSSANAVPVPGTPRPAVRGSARRESAIASIRGPARGTNAT
jgi:transposase